MPISGRWFLNKADAIFCISQSRSLSLSIFMWHGILSVPRLLTTQFTLSEGINYDSKS